MEESVIPVGDGEGFSGGECDTGRGWGRGLVEESVILVGDGEGFSGGECDTGRGWGGV